LFFSVFGVLAAAVSVPCLRGRGGNHELFGTIQTPTSTEGEGAMYYIYF
jgi:hypothetical protein